MNTEHYKIKYFVYKCFGNKYYHKIKSCKILFDFLIHKDYDDINKYFSRILEKNSIVLDIGANMGQYMLRLSKMKSIKNVIAVEPILNNYKALSKFKKILKLHNVQIYKLAISNQTGISEIRTPCINGVPITTQATLSKVFDGKIETTNESVRTSTLDDFVGELNLPRLDFIKIDAEGFDNIIINSGKGIIKKYKPTIKTESECIDSSLNWLKEIGYIKYKIYEGRLLVYKTFNDNMKIPSDTFLTPRDKIGKIKSMFR